MRSRRPRTAMSLVGMGIILLAAVFVGQQIGEHTIFGATERRVEIPEQPVTPVPAETGPGAGLARDWKRLQVVSVATDPAFPDPRITKPPPPTPRPTRSPKPFPTPDLYTAPPAPQALASQLPAVGASPDVAR